MAVFIWVRGVCVWCAGGPWHGGGGGGVAWCFWWVRVIAMVTRCYELRLPMCYFVAMVASCALRWTLWHFFCGGLSACWILALAGFGGWGCCGLQLLLWVHVGGGGGCACFVAARRLLFASDMHCVVVYVEMDARDCGFDSFFACVLLRLLACLTCRLQLLRFGSSM